MEKIHPGYWVALVLGLFFFVGGCFILPVLMYIDQGGNNAPIPPWVASSVASVGSLVVGAVLSAVYRDRQLSIQHEIDIKKLRRDVCSTASVLNVGTLSAFDGAKEAMDAATNPKDAALFLLGRLRDVATLTASAVGAIHNTFGAQYKDGVSTITTAARESSVVILDRPGGSQMITAPTEEFYTKPNDRSSSTSVVLHSDKALEKPLYQRISGNCPRCNRILNGIKVPLLSREVPCFCVGCSSSLKVIKTDQVIEGAPRVGIEWIGPLKRVEPAAIMGRMGRKHLLKCPDCGKNYPVLTSSRLRDYALCKDDQVLLVARHGDVMEWENAQTKLHGEGKVGNGGFAEFFEVK